MKKLISLLVITAMLTSLFVIAAPATADNTHLVLYEAALILPTPDGHQIVGKAEIFDESFVAEIEFQDPFDQPGAEYNVNISYGFDPNRISAHLGTIITDENGRGKGSFSLLDLPNALSSGPLDAPKLINFPGFLVIRPNPSLTPPNITLQTSFMLPPDEVVYGNLVKFPPVSQVDVGDIVCKVVDGHLLKIEVRMIGGVDEKNLVDYDILVGIFYTEPPLPSTLPDSGMYFANVLSTNENGFGFAQVQLEVDPGLISDNIWVSVQVRESPPPPSVPPAYVSPFPPIMVPCP